ncbi:uncharacterized protein LOC120675713 isoform X2 [Panicum virgatum]|uniref:Uncharacterized protein n=1 Tax=Panicum virgatum TaxID=38727 RepID=A0A8T0RUL1_PANVG|nr:uncharacterized protein LOC120675713 isoform X2 [Panicum virgatum]XP_039812853.1 uncharacterized protein LOC120675713 isoform X2 [Panicum virgatum]XP_039812854.1 uncharacterized protein LOC120675713 isoform X2 [Panicum virgatum]XP_039812855.1 uncharacterized protein LOC120675713 isoform X2 [Panicum virgatum]KAG2590202.1 hypothetical protein PVAP13_5NG280100 [Panicum virgatum]
MLPTINLRDKRFEVICPFKDTALVENDSLSAIAKFRKVFKAVHSRSTRIDIYDMPTVIGSVSNQTNQNDSGVFILQLLLAYNGKTHFHFTQEHSKPLRESLTYYLCAHENELIMLEIRQIAYQHGIKLEDYTARIKRYSKK